MDLIEAVNNKQVAAAERILSKEGLMKPYVNKNSFGPTYGEHKHALELGEPEWNEMKKYADEVGILFFASGWDEDSVDFLDRVGCPFYKVASADLTNFPLLEHTARKGKPEGADQGRPQGAKPGGNRSRSRNRNRSHTARG